MPEAPKPEPCKRCGNDDPLGTSSRDESYFYTAALSIDAECTRIDSDTNRPPRGRLCEGCTRAFAQWLRGEN